MRIKVLMLVLTTLLMISQIVTATTLVVYVHNIRGYNMPGCSGEIYGILYSYNSPRSWSASRTYYPHQKYVVLTFNNVPAPGKYVLEIYNIPFCGMRFTEFWGRKIINLGFLSMFAPEVKVQFYRDNPYIEGISAYPRKVILGKKVTIRVTIDSLDTEGYAKVCIYLATKPGSSSYMFETCKSLYICRESCETVTFEYAPKRRGQYYIYAILFLKINTSMGFTWTITDQWNWYPLFKVVVPSSNVIVNVYNVEKLHLPSCGGTITCILSSSTNRYIRTISYYGGQSYVTCSFKNVTPGSYVLYVYNKPNCGLKYTEFWGSKKINVPPYSNINVEFIRFEPWIDHIEYSHKVKLGSTILLKVYVRNSASQSHEVRVCALLSRSVGGSIIMERCSQAYIPSSETMVPVTINLGSANEIGTYYIYLILYTKINSKYLITDQYYWTSFEIYRPIYIINTLTVYVYGYSYGNRPIPGGIVTCLLKGEGRTYIAKEQVYPYAANRPVKCIFHKIRSGKYILYVYFKPSNYPEEFWGSRNIEVTRSTRSVIFNRYPIYISYIRVLDHNLPSNEPILVSEGSNVKISIGIINEKFIEYPIKIEVYVKHEGSNKIIKHVYTLRTYSSQIVEQVYIKPSSSGKYYILVELYKYIPDIGWRLVDVVPWSTAFIAYARPSVKYKYGIATILKTESSTITYLCKTFLNDSWYDNGGIFSKEYEKILDETLDFSVEELTKAIFMSLEENLLEIVSPELGFLLEAVEAMITITKEMCNIIRLQNIIGLADGFSSIAPFVDMDLWSHMENIKECLILVNADINNILKDLQGNIINLKEDFNSLAYDLLQLIHSIHNLLVEIGYGNFIAQAGVSTENTYVPGVESKIAYYVGRIISAIYYLESLKTLLSLVNTTYSILKKYIPNSKVVKSIGAKIYEIKEEIIKYCNVYLLPSILYKVVREKNGNYIVYVYLYSFYRFEGSVVYNVVDYNENLEIYEKCSGTSYLTLSPFSKQLLCKFTAKPGDHIVTILNFSDNIVLLVKNPGKEAENYLQYLIKHLGSFKYNLPLTKLYPLHIIISRSLMENLQGFIDISFNTYYTNEPYIENILYFAPKNNYIGYTVELQAGTYMMYIFILNKTLYYPETLVYYKLIEIKGPGKLTVSGSNEPYISKITIPHRVIIGDSIKVGIEIYSPSIKKINVCTSLINRFKKGYSYRNEIVIGPVCKKIVVHKGYNNVKIEIPPLLKTGKYYVYVYATTEIQGKKFVITQSGWKYRIEISRPNVIVKIVGPKYLYATERSKYTIQISDKESYVLNNVEVIVCKDKLCKVILTIRRMSSGFSKNIVINIEFNKPGIHKLTVYLAPKIFGLKAYYVKYSTEIKVYPVPEIKVEKVQLVPNVIAEFMLRRINLTMYIDVYKAPIFNMPIMIYVNNHLIRKITVSLTPGKHKIMINNLNSMLRYCNINGKNVLKIVINPDRVVPILKEITITREFTVKFMVEIDLKIDSIYLTVGVCPLCTYVSVNSRKNSFTIPNNVPTCINVVFNLTTAAIVESAYSKNIQAYVKFILADNGKVIKDEVVGVPYSVLRNKYLEEVVFCLSNFPSSINRLVIKGSVTAYDDIEYMDINPRNNIAELTINAEHVMSKCRLKITYPKTIILNKPFNIRINIFNCRDTTLLLIMKYEKDKMKILKIERNVISKEKEGILYIGPISGSISEVDIIAKAVSSGKIRLMIGGLSMSPGSKFPLPLRSVKLSIVAREQEKRVHRVLECDFNLDGRLDVGDVVLLLRILVGTYHSNIPCDLNHNGRLDIGDAILLLEKLVGLS